MSDPGAPQLPKPSDPALHLDAVLEHLRHQAERSGDDPLTTMSPLEKAELHITEARRRAEGYEAMLDVARRHGLSDEVERLEGLAEAADFAADSWEDQRQRLVDGEPPEPSHPGDDDGLFDEQ